MFFWKLSCFVLVFALNWLSSKAILLVIPEDVPTGLVGIYGFAPRIVKGTDSRLGFGFRLGNHADFQILYEFGPQEKTRPLRVRSVPYTQRLTRRRPFVELLLKTGFLRISSPGSRYDIEEFDYEPR